MCIWESFKLHASYMSALSIHDNCIIASLDRDGENIQACDMRVSLWFQKSAVMHPTSQFFYCKDLTLCANSMSTRST